MQKLQALEMDDSESAQKEESSSNWTMSDMFQNIGQPLDRSFRYLLLPSESNIISSLLIIHQYNP